MILVDEARWPWRGRYWAHLVSDESYDELHVFASRLGMRREWFQHKESRPHQAHYDLPERSRQAALDLGAVAVTWRQLARLTREWRHAGVRPAPPGPP